ncbi:nucleotidyltransferase domain-containing protein [Pyrofollis japonicus]|uniref:nucleotidyltransferase domain-containing protein n=1 Tax=Pyrofollis japonicus TaxID=3060460 RepID=UPI00295A8171|nr:nucleotidyltransferase domain-containing protein [Pyrofollis japonicus]BEP16700.1 nucleotidyltransferase domain-containing protein [Pyrofollis japonicus]
MAKKIDVLMAKWFFELRDTWRQAAQIVARAAKALYPEAKVYVIGSVAEDRFTAISDLDILVVLPYDPDPRERLRIKISIMRRAFDEGLPLHYPVDLHIAGPKRLQEYRKYVKRMIRIDDA